MKDIFIAPNGSDADDGTRDRPLATFDRAFEEVRSHRRWSPEEPITVWVAGGRYHLDRPVALTAAESGAAAAPVCVRAVDGQTPVLTNARRLTPQDFQPVTDPATLDRIDEAARGKIVALDLDALGIRHAAPPPAVFADSGGMPALYVNGRRMPLARFPKSGFLTMKTVLTNGEARRAPGVFVYREEDHAKFERWREAVDRGIWLKGYWRVMWQNEAIRIRSIDTGAHTVTFAAGVAGGIGSKYHRPGGDGREQYWLLNLLEAVSLPGEWCIDYQDRKLYLYPPEPLAQACIYLGDCDEPLLTVTGASHVVVRGLTFECGLGDAMILAGGSDNLIAGCTVRLMGRYAIRIKGGTGHTVLSNDLHHLGEGGVWLSGGDEDARPRRAAGHKVVNNHIHHFGEIVKVYAPGINCGYAGGELHLAAVGNLVAHNLVHDTPHGGILFGSWDNVFEYNEIFRFCLTSNDLGGFYSFCRYDHMGNSTFRYNLIHSSVLGDGIYFDRDHRDMHVYGNIAYLRSKQVAKNRGEGFLFKIGTQGDPRFNADPANAQPLDCHDNIAVACNCGFDLFVPDGLPSRIENNIAVACKTPWSCHVVGQGEARRAPDGPILEKNRSYADDPGFVDMEGLNFNLRPDSPVLADLPSFQPIPVDRIGLFVDEHRTRLPTDEEIDRLSRRTSMGGAGYAIEDRDWTHGLD